MGSKNQVDGINSYQMSYEDGYLKILSLEQEKAGDFGQWKNCFIRAYNVTNSPKSSSITAIVYVSGEPDQSKAEWIGKLFVKGLHASVYKEAVLAVPTEKGFDVYVKWMIWKPTSRQS
jgi:hypothetical protein